MHPGDTLDCLDAELDVLAFEVFGHRLVVEPAVAVADDLVPVFDIGARQFRVAFGSFGDGQ